jgi:integrase
MASIYKRGKSWHVQYRENGKLVQRSLKTTSKRIAEQKLAEIEVNLSREPLGMGRRLTSSQAAFSGFMQEVIARKSPPWQKRMEQLVRPFQTWATEQSVLVTQITKAEIEDFLRSRRKEIADKTWNEELAIIRRFFDWLKDHEYLVKSPAAKIERVQQNPRAIRIFSAAEIQLIMRHATPTQRPFYQLLLFTGLRDGELRNLEWSDVDLLRGLVHVRVKQDWKPKTGRGRTVPLAAEARALLSALPRRSNYVFATRNGKPWVPPRQPWVDLLNRIHTKEGMDLRGQVSLHTFRHTFATVSLMRGIDIKTVSEFLGHTSIRMTEKYLHVLPDHKMAAINKVDFGRFLEAADASVVA